MLILTIVLMLVVVGVFLWALDALPWIDANAKALIRILVIVTTVLWIIHKLFPGILPW